MFAPAILTAVLLLHAAPPALAPAAPPDNPPPSQPTPAPDSALAQLSPEARGKAARRAKFVYRLPDGTVWDSWLYCEFREVLREFDALPKDAQPSPRARAWGFKAGSRQVAAPDSRPSPLWHSASDARNKGPTFIYINTAHATAADKGRKPMIEVTDELEPWIYQLWVREYPREAVGRLPSSFGIYGTANIIAHIPAEVGARPGQSLSGEFFFVTDPEVKKPKDAHSLHQPCRIIHAAKLRLNPEQYAQALLAGEVEMIEWSFRRTTDRLGEKFEWTRRIVDAKGSTTSDTQASPPIPDSAESPR